MFDLQRFATVNVVDFGFISSEDKQKLDGIATGAQVNTIENIYLDGAQQTISEKGVTLNLSAYAKKTDIASGLTFKGTVASYQELPATASAGWMYNVKSTGGQDSNGNNIMAGDNIVYNGTGWEVMSSTVDLSNYVQKDGNKVLSDNNYTTAEKDKLASVESGAQVNRIEVVQINGTSQSIDNKTLTLDLSDYVQKDGTKQLSAENYTTAEKTKLATVSTNANENVIESIQIDGATQAVSNKIAYLDLSGYQPAIQGKTLTTNDYTTAEKTKLAGISAGANSNVIESVQIDGTTQTVDTETKTVTLDLSDYAKLSDISASLTYKGVVDSYDDLPANPSAGHVYNVRTAGGEDASGTPISAGDSLAYNGTGWDILGGSIDLSGYQEKETGKGLSTNDYTTTEKTKLQEIEAGAQVNKLETITINGAVQTITNKNATLSLDTWYVRKDGTKTLTTNDYTTAEKTKLANLTEGAEPNVIEAVTINGTTQTVSNKTVALDLSAYVQKDGAKTLTTNDYTTAEKNKLAGIAAGAQQNVIESVTINNRTQTINPTTKAVELDLSGYVAVTPGKDLSTNDFTNAYKDQLDNLPTGTLVTTATGDLRYLGISDTAAAAVKDGDNNTITDTYATKAELQAYIAGVRLTANGIVLVDGAGNDVCVIPVAGTAV